MHGHNILHRDLKTLNIFLTKENKVKIGDLGVAKILESLENFATSKVGTPYYLSPEVCEDRPYNNKSDIWSLGCILYELCALKHPFEAKTQAALLLKIIRGKYESLPRVYSRQLGEIVHSCLMKDFKKRPSISTILQLEIVQSKAQLLRLQLPVKRKEKAAFPLAEKTEEAKNTPAPGLLASSLNRSSDLRRSGEKVQPQKPRRPQQMKTDIQPDPKALQLRKKESQDKGGMQSPAKLLKPHRVLSRNSSNMSSSQSEDKSTPVARDSSNTSPAA